MLIISLMFLVILTIIGLYLASDSVMQLRMAGNSSAKAISFETAETTRSYAEAQMIILANNISSNGISYFNCATRGDGYYASANGADAGAIGCSVMGTAPVKWISVPDSTNSKFAIEFLGEDSISEVSDDTQIGAETFDVFVFRILSQGSTSTGATTQIESLFITRKS